MLAVAYPNFLGQIEDFTGLAEKVHAAGALLVFVANPMALALFKSPGELGADIVVGEGQPLGIPLSYGGPYLGFFATKMAQIRRIAGRIVGETRRRRRQERLRHDAAPARAGHPPREGDQQHLHQHGLDGAGGDGLHGTAGQAAGCVRSTELCYHKAHYAADQIDALDGYAVDRSKPFFNEFVVNCPVPVQQINDRLLIERHHRRLRPAASTTRICTNQMLLCVDRSQQQRRDRRAGRSAAARCKHDQR